MTARAAEQRSAIHASTRDGGAPPDRGAPPEPPVPRRLGGEGAIAFYFRAQSLFERSTFGATLDRARLAAYDATGARIPSTRRSWHWQPECMVTDGHRLRRDPDAPAPPMLVHPDRGEGGGYEVDDDALVRFAGASRRMLALERASPSAKRTLEAYYGDRGGRWAAFGADVTDAAGKVTSHGAGPGAIAAVYLLTPLGQRFIAKERERAAKRAGAGVVLDLMDDELLAVVFAIQKAQPKQDRANLLNRVRDQAEELLLEAREAWQATRPADLGARRHGFGAGQ